MASPFPGMDPYLEAFWRDVHHRLVTYACDQLQGQLPGDLRARLEKRVFVETAQAPGRSMYPDIRLVERGRGQAAVTAEIGLAVAEPLVIHLPDEPVTQGYIEVIDIGSGNKVVTVIEVLSLSNKLPGQGQELYLQKQRELQQGHVSLVEINLLRAGQHVMSVPPERIPLTHRTPYIVCVRRGWRPLEPEIYSLPLRERLRSIKVPLRETDQDVLLHLQTLIEQCYHNGGYDDDIDYRHEPDPPLPPDDALWADELLRSQKRR